MKSDEDKLNQKLRRLVYKIYRTTKKFRFNESVLLLKQVQDVLNEGNCSAGANPDLGECDDYPPVRESAYLSGQQPADVVARIEKFASKIHCDCQPVSCECSPTTESPITAKDIKCLFCKAELARFTNAYWISETLGKGTICRTCKIILMDKAYPESSAAEDINNLAYDACEEVCFLQFAKAQELLEDAQRRAEKACQLPNCAD